MSKAKLRRAIDKALKPLGFTSVQGQWRSRLSVDWSAVVDYRYAEFDGTARIWCDLGIYSLRVDEFMGWSELSGAFRKDQLPPTYSFGHFCSSIFRLDEDGRWLSTKPGSLDVDKQDLDKSLANLSIHLAKCIPPALDRYSNLQEVIAAYERGEGYNRGSRDHAINIAAAYLLLGQPKSAKKLLDEKARFAPSETFGPTIVGKLRAAIEDLST